MRCSHCDRFLNVEIVATSIIRVRCNDRRCKKWNDIKAIKGDATESQLKYKFPKP